MRKYASARGKVNGLPPSPKADEKSERTPTDTPKRFA